MRTPHERMQYRARQFVRALRERREPAPTAFVHRHLSDSGRRLFYSQSRRDQAHSARTAAALAHLQPEGSDLIVAALLHDIGKGPQQLWQRVAFVLLDGLFPRLLRRLARPGDGWRGAMERSRTHAETGAEMARLAGYPESICRLIACHHQSVESGAVRALQWADERA